MNNGRIYRQYQWIIKTLLEHKGITFDELNRRWLEDDVADGKALQRSTFNRHRDSLLDIFGIVIECDLSTYRYYIANPEVLRSDGIARWLLSTMSVHAALSDCAAVKDRIVLENVPGGADLLPVIIRAIKSNRMVVMTYQRFGAPSYDKTVAPYALKLFHQRWYMLAFTGNHYATYALDRMLAVRLSDETFSLPDGFSPHDFFSEYFGVLTDDTPMTHVVVRAHNFTPDYLRTLPLHASQREIASTEHYTDFSFDIRPTFDFLGQLMSHGDGIEVLEPADLRQKMKELIENSQKRY